MAYQALYRRHRPTTFDDVVGQEHITRTLKNEIASGRISHAYLFTGIRGTGKTSTAKIFSKAINCLDSVDGNPCNECTVCKGIADGSILDVVEMDAASNNGVENIRDIREEVIYTASVAKYKVYIIDEVHMLSTGAFNALLKTLEEPPEHVIFILATTEVHKLPATILSRCQRFDFRMITTEDIKKHLLRLANADGIELSGEALDIIASMGEGSMRDAISILDRCIAFGKKTLDTEDVINILGAPDEELCCRIFDAILGKDALSAITISADALAAGRTPARLLDGLMRLAREMIMIKLAKTGTGARKSELIEKFTYEKLVNCVKVLSETSASMRYASSPRTVYEMGLLKLCMPIYDSSAEALADRVSVLEEQIKKGVVVEKKAVPPKKEEKKAEEVSPTKKEIKFGGKYKDKWQEIIKEVSTKNPGLPVFLSKLTPAGEGDMLILVASNEEQEEAMNFVNNDRFKEIILNAAETVCGARPQKLSFEQNVTNEQNKKLIDRLKNFDFVEICE